MPLSHADNELLTRVTGDAPMGRMLRRYWVPACLSEEVAERDGAPVRTTILGERLIVWRDTDGTVAVTQEACPHRLASLGLGRNEEGGIRCIYHGWKFNAAGACVDMPTEPGEHGFRDRMRIKSYPVREAGGMIWTYLGPDGTEPVFPLLDWMQLPRSQYGIVKVGEIANYAQAIEGSIDSSHSWFLHQGILWDWKLRFETSRDTAPKMEAEDMPYGFRYAAIRIPNADPERTRYVRVTVYVLPFMALIPRPMDRSKTAHVQIFVPIDDHRTMFYGIFFSQDGSEVSDAKVRETHHLVPGRDLDRNWFKLGTVDNWFHQDRDAMKNGDWTGIKGFTNQDMACQETMGPIVDRTQEHLGTSDIAIIRMRKRLLDAVRAFEAEGTLVGQDPNFDWNRVKSEQLIMPIETPWQTLGKDVPTPA